MVCGVIMARAADGESLYPKGRTMSTLRLSIGTRTAFGYSKYPSAPHAGMTSLTPCWMDARPMAMST